MKQFIKWLVVFSLTLLGLATLFYTGIMCKIAETDKTWLTFLILAIFLLTSFKLGWQLLKNRKINIENFHFACNVFVKLGLIGTVCGFIYMLYYTFMGIDVTDITSTRNALLCMAKGMGTALFTTAAGLICNLILKIQLFIYENK